MSRIAVLAELHPAEYQRHSLHADSAVWVEKNCYIDVWIEVIHAYGCEPLAILPFVLAIDFEGDQWTFFKPPHDELRRLYGLDVQELNVWRSLVDHALEHLAAGKMISTEADAFWLPDTQGTDYQRQHTKTTIVMNDLDLQNHRLGYFHNAAYHSLEGRDFDQLLRFGAAPDPPCMPLFAEIIRASDLIRRDPHALRVMSLEILRTHVARRPANNPVLRFSQRFVQDLPWLISNGLAFYHTWAFATLRQLGAAAELAASYFRWLDDATLLPAAEPFDQLSNGAKTLILKAARAVNAGRSLDATELFNDMSQYWQRGMDIAAEASGV